MLGTVSACLLIIFFVTKPAKNSPEVADAKALDQFNKVVSPILQKRCYDCHGDGAHKANLAFDMLTTKDEIHNPQLWLKVLKNTRSHAMPPPS